VSKLDPRQTLITLPDEIPWQVPDGVPPDSVAEAVLAGAEEQEGSETIQSWMSAGLIDASLGDAATLAYALMTPIIQARIVWMHPDAAPESRQLARDVCHRHVEFFIKATFVDSDA
jgi:hypothetical protein